MVGSSSDYSRAYETAKRELAELIVAEERLARRKVELRKTIEVLATLCGNEQIEVDPSAQAAYLLEHSSLADEIRQILRSKYPAWLRPLQIKTALEELGHDFSENPNPQATIQMVLKRMTESESKEAEECLLEGKKAYRSPGPGLSALTGGLVNPFTPEVINSIQGLDLSKLIEENLGFATIAEAINSSVSESLKAFETLRLPPPGLTPPRPVSQPKDSGKKK